MRSYSIFCPVFFFLLILSKTFSFVNKHNCKCLQNVSFYVSCVILKVIFPSLGFTPFAFSKLFNTIYFLIIFLGWIPPNYNIYQRFDYV